MNADSEVSAPKRGRGCLFWFVVLLFALPVGIVGAIVLLFGWRDMAAQRQFEQRVTALRSQGLPVDHDSMSAYHAQLTSEDTVADWLEVLEILRGPEFAADSKGIPIVGNGSEAPFPENGEPWEDEAAVRNFLEKYRTLHDRVMRLCIDAEPVRFPIKWEGTATLLPDTQTMRGAARLLSLRGQLALYDRDAAAVRRSVDASIGCSVTLEGEPTMVSQFVAVAIDQIALATLKSGIEQDILRPDDLRYLIKRVLPRTKLRNHWEIALNGERAMMLPIYQDSSVAERELGGAGNLAARLPFRGRDANTYLDIIDQATEADTSNLDAFIRDTRALEDEVQNSLSRANLIQQLDHMLTAMVTPALGAAGNAVADQAIMNRLALTAMAIRLHELDTGSFPESLSDLHLEGVSQKDLMPPGGQPFGYELTDEYAYLWGFSLRMNQTSVPAIRPTVSDAEPNSDFKRSVIWRLVPHPQQDSR